MAIVGMAFQFPQCEDWDSLTQILRAGHDCFGGIPPARAAGTGIVRANSDQDGGWIEDITGFDRHYFGLARAEAELIDPRQRKLLELAVRTMGDAGYSPQELRSRAVSVYLAASSGLDPTLYDLLAEEDKLSAHGLTGSMGALAAGRIAYHFDLRGAALTIDTACSSFLVALHEARWNLARGEDEMALVGGFELVLGRPPARPSSEQGLGVLSSSGRCRPFDKESDGATFGEGGGFVLIKPLAHALRDGNTIHAIVRGSAVNQDAARSSGLTAPSSRAQSEVIASAFRDAGVDPLTVSYIEAHGTGTKIGDPIEIQGLAEAFGGSGASRLGRALTPVSSVKGNFGHLDSMASFAGLARIIAQFRAKKIFPTAHFTSPNPLLALEGTGLRIADRIESWDADLGPRRASLSSFGLSGTNAHAVVEDAHAALSASPIRTESQVVVLSARTAPSLVEYAEQLHRIIANDPAGYELLDVADVLTYGREHSALFPHKRAWVVTGIAGLLERLEEVRHGDTETEAKNPPFLVVALGDQRDGVDAARTDEMRELAATYPGFARAIADAEMHLPLEQLSRRQLAIVANVGELNTLADFGIEPDFVLAHGNGAAAARCARGLDDLSHVLDEALSAKEQVPPDADRLRAAISGFGEHTLVIDLAGGSALSGLLQRSGSLRVLTFSDKSFAEVLAELHQNGVILDWRSGRNQKPRRRLALPTPRLANERLWPNFASSEAKSHSQGSIPLRLSVPAGGVADLVLSFAREVLKEPGIELDDDFFAKGGNSLNAVSLASRLNEALGVDLDMADLFDYSNLRDLAAAVAPTPSPDLCQQPQVAPMRPIPISVPMVGTLSGQQMAIWAATQLTPESSAYNVSAAFLFVDDIDKPKVLQRLETAIRRHPMLRTHLRDTEDGPVQEVASAATTQTTIEEVRFVYAGTAASASTLGRKQFLADLRALVAEPLSPYATPPTRYQLARAEFADGTMNALVVTFHHLFFDGWSWKLFMESLTEELDAPAPLRTYLDFVNEQSQMLDGDRGRLLGSFWANQLNDAPAVTLPADFEGIDTAFPASIGLDIPINIDPELAAGLRKIGRENRATLNMVLLAAWSVLLWRITDCRDITVAGPIAGRSTADAETVGCFANTVVLRASLVPDHPFQNVLSTIRAAQLAALTHGDFPADRIIRTARPRSTGPVTSTNFGFQVEEDSIHTFGPGGPRVELLDVDPSTPTFELNVAVLDLGNAVIASIKFNSALFREATVARWAKEYVRMLRQLVQSGVDSTLFDLFETLVQNDNAVHVPTFKF